MYVTMNPRSVRSNVGHTFKMIFGALSRAFSPPEIDYTDISQSANSWRRRLKRWATPLGRICATNIH
ncbi:hypothetical protein KCP71_07460 [Salmonella enterica subsp. enterica]|nr:hypothetical protein KCP71_07460 [Salmonella enterica subsp. enterica]